MNTWKKSLSSLIIAMMLITLLPVTALAAVTAQVTGTGALTVTTTTYGELKNAVDASGVPYADVKSITLTAGLLNSKDTVFINTYLTNLATFNVIGTADFQDSTVPDKAFELNFSLQDVKFLNTKIIGSKGFYKGDKTKNGKLKTVELPKVTQIGDRTFYRTPLTTLILPATPPKMMPSKSSDDGYWFKEVDNVSIFVPTQDAIDIYQDTYAFAGFSMGVIGGSAGGSGDTTGGYKGYGNAKVLPRKNAYYTGDFKIGLNFYSFNTNLNAWKNNSNGIPKLGLLEAIKWAKDVGFDAVDVTQYYIPGHETGSLTPEKDKPGIMQWARDIKAKAKEVGIDISGTGSQNNFIQPDATKRQLDVDRYKFWIDVAQEMGAPVIRVFAGATPSDTNKLGWEKVVQDRLVPALKELADYGAARGVKIGLQNHGDIISNADQTIQVLKWVNHPNVGIIDDTGYFKEFGNPSTLGYNWYADINAVLPNAVNFQVKKKPGGANTSELIDLDRLFSGIRSSDYRGYIPLELLWNPGDPGHPNDLATPPYDEVSAFLAKVKAAMQNTKTSGKIGQTTLSGTPGNGTAILSWTPSPYATSGYFVKKKMADNSYSLVSTVSAATYAYTDFSGVSNVAGTYVVTGFNNEREYAESNEISVTPQRRDRQSSGDGGTGGVGGSGGAASGAGTASGSTSGGNTNASGDKDGVKLAVSTITEKSGDKTVAKVAVTSESFNKAVDAVKNNASGQQTITIQVDGNDPIAVVQLPADGLIQAQAAGEGIVLSIKSDISTYDLPLKAINTTAVAVSLNADPKATVNIQIEKVSGSSAEDVSKKAAQSGLNLLSGIVDYKITAQTNDKSEEINDFNGVYVPRTLSLPTAVDENKTTAVMYNPASGKFSFVPAIFSTDNKVVIKRSGNSMYTVVQNSKTFGDVSDHWAKNDIEQLASKLVVEGATDNSFAPNKSITRAEFAALLVRSLALNPVKDGTFKDISSSDWYAEAVNTAAKVGLVNGFEGSLYKPNDTITREQMAVMITRAMEFTGNTAKGSNDSIGQFKDSGSISSWAQNAVVSAVNAKIINGVTDTTFVPSANATRAEATVMLKRLLKYVQFIN